MYPRKDSSSGVSLAGAKEFAGAGHARENQMEFKCGYPACTTWNGTPGWFWLVHLLNVKTPSQGLQGEGCRNWAPFPGLWTISVWPAIDDASPD
jgi:hypothetical protein